MEFPWIACNVHWPAAGIAAGRAALTAGEILRSKYDTPLKICNKGRIDLVTEVDVAAEQAILKVLRRAHPDIGVLAEESAANYQAPHTAGQSEPALSGQPGPGPAGPDLNAPLWVIDPLDGTTNFAHAFPWFALSIGYLEEGQCRAGIIYNPVSEEFSCGMAGGGGPGFGLRGLRPAGRFLGDQPQTLGTRRRGSPYSTRRAGLRFRRPRLLPFHSQLLASNGALHDNLRQALNTAE